MKKLFSLLHGEEPLTNAPIIELGNGKSCIPQHYLFYKHSLKSVEQIVALVDFDESYPVFACEDEKGIYVQVGVIGFDNYHRLSSDKKIVYGRKWRIETQLPSSEIIQTIFLAIKKAREHEIRELFRLEVQG